MSSATCALGMSAKDAAHKTMDEVGGALISIALTLVRRFRSVGLPLGHLRTVLSPVRGHDRSLDSDLLLCFADAEPGAVRGALQGTRIRPGGSRRVGCVDSCMRAFDRFNRGFERVSNGYGNLTRRLVRGRLSSSWSIRADRPCGIRVLPRADGFHPGAGPGLPHHGRAVTARATLATDRGRW